MNDPIHHYHTGQLVAQGYRRDKTLIEEAVTLNVAACFSLLDSNGRDWTIAELRWGNMQVYLHRIKFSDAKTGFKSNPQWQNANFISCGQYHGCWWPIDIRRQAISSFTPEYCGLSTGKPAIDICMCNTICTFHFYVPQHKYSFQSVHHFFNHYILFFSPVDVIFQEMLDNSIHVFLK